MGMSGCASVLSDVVGAVYIEPGGVCLNLSSVYVWDGTVSVCEVVVDAASVAGGGLVTDMVKGTVSGAFHEGDARDSHIYVVVFAVDGKSFAVRASITLVVGLEVSVLSASINDEISSKKGSLIESNCFAAVSTDFESIPMSFVH